MALPPDKEPLGAIGLKAPPGELGQMPYFPPNTFPRVRGETGLLGTRGKKAVQWGPCQGGRGERPGPSPSGVHDGSVGQAGYRHVTHGETKALK